MKNKKIKGENREIQNNSLTKRIDKTNTNSVKKISATSTSESNINKVMPKDKKRKSIYIGVVPRIVFMILSIIILIILFRIFLNNAINFKKENKLTYNSNSNIDYKVYLKDNNYYDASYLESGRQYITDIIDYIDVDFNYDLNISDDSDVEYKYYIMSNLLITERGSKEQILYDKKEILLEQQVIKKSDLKKINIFENIKIDYDKYNDLVTSFKSRYILSVDSRLLITLHVDVVGKNKNISDIINDYQDIDINIPLSEQTIQIQTDYDDNGNDIVLTNYTEAKIINIIYFILSLISVISMVVLVMLFMEFLNKIMVKTTTYTKKIKKILKEYDQAIVILKKVPDVKDLNIIEVSSFEELLDARANLDKPILLIELNKNQKSWFIILDGNIMYRFILKASDLEKYEK